MKQGLFESLTGHFLDKTAIDAVPDGQRKVMSVMDHLSRMFNTRLGSLTHLPEYGLPDISDIYRKMPDGIEDLRLAIENAITKYEPRMRKVSVTRKDPGAAKILKLEFIVAGEMRDGGVVRFQTLFTSTGNSSISPWRKID